MYLHFVGQLDTHASQLMIWLSLGSVNEAACMRGVLGRPQPQSNSAAILFWMQARRTASRTNESIAVRLWCMHHSDCYIMLWLWCQQQWLLVVDRVISVLQYCWATRYWHASFRQSLLLYQYALQLALDSQFVCLLKQNVIVETRQTTK